MPSAASLSFPSSLPLRPHLAVHSHQIRRIWKACEFWHLSCLLGHLAADTHHNRLSYNVKGICHVTLGHYCHAIAGVKYCISPMIAPITSSSRWWKMSTLRSTGSAAKRLAPLLDPACDAVCFSSAQMFGAAGATRAQVFGMQLLGFQYGAVAALNGAG